jgi:predicted neuraminidase
MKKKLTCAKIYWDLNELSYKIPGKDKYFTKRNTKMKFRIYLIVIITISFFLFADNLFADDYKHKSGLIREGFVFDPGAEPPSSHASTVYEMPDSSILCAWYSGSSEAAPDVAVYASRLTQGVWSKPVIIADTPDKPEGNPVLYTNDQDKVFLYFVTIHGLGWNWAKIKYRVSNDNGETWGPVIMLRDKRGWMIRNHPVKLSDGRLLMPFYSENKWCSEFMVSENNGEDWDHISEVCSRPGNIQASVVELGNNELYATMRTGARGKQLWQTRSYDGGKTWSKAEQTNIPNPNSGTDMIKLDTGEILLAFNNSKKNRTPLSLALSSDGGHSWGTLKNIEDGPGEYSYPSLCQSKDGAIHLTYTYQRKTIKHVAFSRSWLE